MNNKDEMYDKIAEQLNETSTKMMQEKNLKKSTKQKTKTIS